MPPVVGTTATDKDAEHLRLLSIFHYVMGGLHMVIGSIFILHFGFGALMASRAPMFGPNPPPQFVGVLLMCIGGGLILLGWGIGICTILSGRFIAQRKNRIFSIVIAAINCLSMPFGTALGVFTMIVLLRDSVRRLYG